MACAPNGPPSGPATEGYAWEWVPCSFVQVPVPGGAEGWPIDPILIDTDGSGFHLTSPYGGVKFDFYGTGTPIQIAWTAGNSTNGWLALDRNGNGTIDNGSELFGNLTPQPKVAGKKPNGFLALAVFDTPAEGGNGDGLIDKRDKVWPRLLVWIDANHDGISQPGELHHLDDIGIHSIDLDYKNSWYLDQYANMFRYKGRLNRVAHDAVSRVMYDVLLQRMPQ